MLLRKYLILCCILFLILQAPKAEVIDRIIAIVNNDIIKLSDFNEAFQIELQRKRSEGYSSYEIDGMISGLRQKILNALIDQKLYDQQIREAKLVTDEKEIDEQIEKIKESQFLTQDQFIEELKNQGLTLKELKDNIRNQRLRMRLISMKVRSKIVITDEDVLAYYESNPDDYKAVTKYHLRTIIKNELNKKNKNLMGEILEKIKSGESFIDMAKNYSDSFAGEGGLLGAFEFDKLSEKISNSIKDLKEGQCTPVIETSQGYQIIYVEKIEKEGKSFEKISGKIKEMLYNQALEKKFQAWMEEIRQSAYIKIIEE